MENEYELRIAAVLAKGMVIMCFRNTVIEGFRKREIARGAKHWLAPERRL